MFHKIIQAFKIKDLRKKILFVLGMLALFRIMASIPMPGMRPERLQDFFDRFQMFGLANVFTGGALDRFSVVMLGLGPYITATIIIQLLTMIFPQLEKLYKEEGEAGRQKINQYGRICTVPFAMLQGYGMLALFQKEGVIDVLSPFALLTTLITITAGTVFLVWIGELITEKGIGNGVSLLIFAGIVSALPSNIGQMLLRIDDIQDIQSYILFFAMGLFIISTVVLFTEARRNIPVSYAKRVRGRKLYGGVSTYLPLNLNPAGVIPIIFAFSVAYLPVMVANFLSGSAGVIGSIARFIESVFAKPWIFSPFLFLLVFLFTYFYTAVTFDPKTIAENLQKMGGFVPGIRPGSSTAKFLNYILNRVLFIGALFLGTIAVMPSLVQTITKVEGFQFLIGGTSVLIVVSVVLETMKQIDAQLQMREYETF